MPMDPQEALRSIRTLVKVALEADDFDQIGAIRKHLEMINTIVEKALPSKKSS